MDTILAHVENIDAADVDIERGVRLKLRRRDHAEGICSDSIEGRVAKIQQASVTHDNVQTKSQHGVADSRDSGKNVTGIGIYDRIQDGPHETNDAQGGRTISGRNNPPES